MGRKRKTTAKRGSKKNAKTFKNDLLAGMLVVVGIIFFVFLTFVNIGVFADVIKSIMFGLFGKAAFVLPLTFVIVGIYSIYNDKRIYMSKQVFKGIGIMTLLSATIACFATQNFDIFSNFVKTVVDTYNFANIGSNLNGVIGLLISSLLVKVIGVLPSQILLVFFTFISCLCVFNVSFAELFYYIKLFLVTIATGICNMFAILFRKEDYENGQNQRARKVNDKINDYEKLDVEGYEESPVNQRKMSRKDKKELVRMNKDRHKAMSSNILVENGTLNVEENLTTNRDEQVEFDFNKLGGKPSQMELEAKQKREDHYFKKEKEQKEDKNIKEVLTIDHTTKHAQIDNYVFPSIDLLTKPKESETFDKNSIRSTAIKLQKTLASFGVDAKVTNITKGPTVTRYELTPSIGVKVSKIVNLSNDIALNLAAKTIRIEAPIPGKAAVGIEVPNSTSESVYLREIIESNKFKEHKSKIALALGKDAAGEIVVGDIAKMPHVLIAGATGSGKSVCINSLIVSILYKAKPSEVKMILIDPKMVELSGYNGIPHLLIPVVTDPKKAAGALNWAVQEMVNRYSLFASKGVKDIKGYNKIIEKEEGAKLPQIVIIIDELADLMMVAPNDVEDAICRLAQMARAAGMHLVIATQRPSVDVITGIIKANIPSRIAFTVSSIVDSRTILDMAGAEKLLGKGDMLYFPVGETKPHRIQGAFITEEEIDSIVNEIKTKNSDTEYNEEIIQSIDKASTDSKNGGASDDEEQDDADEYLNEAIDLVVDMGQASASMLQRKFRIGYSRAGRIIDQMEARGIISGYVGSKPRQVLISKNEWEELKMGSTMKENKEIPNDTSIEDLNVPVSLEDKADNLSVAAKNIVEEE